MESTGQRVATLATAGPAEEAGHAWVEAPEGSSVATATAMASPVRVVVARRGAAAACEAAVAVFGSIEAACSRFDPTSRLSAVNAHPERWHRPGRTCYAALREAWWAYQRTGGRYDPRVSSAPTASGKPSSSHRGNEDRGRERAGHRVTARAAALRLPWRPRFDDQAKSVHLGGSPVDLQGIGRGLAVRRARDLLATVPHLIEAGGDCYGTGRAPDGGPWRVAVEDPTGSGRPLAVLAISDVACATSARRRRPGPGGALNPRHRADPVTGGAAGDGLLAVTVVGPDPVMAEVWSKALLSAGVTRIATEASRRGLGAGWVTEDGTFSCNAALASRLLWRC